MILGGLLCGVTSCNMSVETWIAYVTIRNVGTLPSNLVLLTLRCQLIPYRHGKASWNGELCFVARIEE